MITEFKIFENNKEPKIGDYVICYDGQSDLEDFLANNVGKIIKKSKNGYGHKNHLGKYLVLYKNIPVEFEEDFKFNNIDGTRPMRRYEILYFSNKEKDCEMYINTNKYNI
jgi:hypothetical protein